MARKVVMPKHAFFQVMGRKFFEELWVNEVDTDDGKTPEHHHFALCMQNAIWFDRAKALRQIDLDTVQARYLADSLGYMIEKWEEWAADRTNDPDDRASARSYLQTARRMVERLGHEGFKPRRYA